MQMVLKRYIAAALMVCITVGCFFGCDRVEIPETTTETVLDQRETTTIETETTTETTVPDTRN